ncbi:hypothetical protein CP8484711_1047A, partial [Chlamydia psittaci 84-8471/1]
MNKLQVHAKQ